MKEAEHDRTPVEDADAKLLESVESMKITAPQKSVLKELIESLIVAVVLAVLVRIFLLAPFYIPSESMQPTLLVGDRIIVDRISYRIASPQRGDIMVFKYPNDPSRDFVKRIVAVGGEIVELRDSRLFINGREIREHYLPAGITFEEYGPVEVPQGHYFMLGDNRNNSDDSRVWGPLPENYIIGKAQLIYWPLPRIRMLHD